MLLRTKSTANFGNPTNEHNSVLYYRYIERQINNLIYEILSTIVEGGYGSRTGKVILIASRRRLNIVTICHKYHLNDDLTDQRGGD